MRGEQTEASDVAPFLDGLETGRLLLSACAGCGHRSVPACLICASCGARDFAWMPSAGRGVVWSRVEFHRAYLPEIPVPYTVVLVALDDGGSIYGMVAEGGYDQCDIGTAVQFDPARSRSGRPTFVPRGTA